jgi:guanylate kinase
VQNINTNHAPIIVTITGPSASGKSVLESMLVERGFGKVVSHTTRTPRPGERDGIDYYFVTREQFDSMNRGQNFLEMVEFGGNLYGASIAEFQRITQEGKPIVIVVEPNGRGQIQRGAEDLGWKVVSVYVECPAEVTAKRLFDRYSKEVWWAKNELEAEKAEATFIKRLSLALGEEQKWRNEARSILDPYDILFFLFDETTQDSLIEAILRDVKYFQEERQQEAKTSEELSFAQMYGTEY